MDTNEKRFLNFDSRIVFANEAGDVVVQRIAPYCDAPQTDANGEQITQRFTLENARRLVEAFAENARKLAQSIGTASLPVYRGHPDHVGNGDGVRDSEVYARVEKLEAREDGLWATIRKSPALAKLKQLLGRLEISPRWACGRSADGTFQPVELISLGLVERGNLPGADVINSLLTKPTIKMNEEQMMKLAELLGCEATADAILAAAEQMKAKLVETEVEKEAAEKQAETANACATEEKKKLETANAKIAVLEADAKKRAEDLANSRKTEAKELLDAAHLAGKITPEQRPALEAFFEADFVNAKLHVQSLVPAKKRSAIADVEAIAKQEAAAKKERTQKFAALANDYFERQLKEGRQIAFADAVTEFSKTAEGMRALKPESAE